MALHSASAHEPGGHAAVQRWQAPEPGAAPARGLAEVWNQYPGAHGVHWVVNPRVVVLPTTTTQALQPAGQGRQSPLGAGACPATQPRKSRVSLYPSSTWVRGRGGGGWTGVMHPTTGTGGRRLRLDGRLPGRDARMQSAKPDHSSVILPWVASGSSPARDLSLSIAQTPHPAVGASNVAGSRVPSPSPE